MYEEDRPKFIPNRFANMRSIPAYENAVKECFERCLDLYLCPRVRKKRLNIDPESLKPKLPSRTELKPYPVACYLEYRGHDDAVTSVSVEASGQWMGSGSLDGTMRIWEVETGRCVKICEIGEAVKYVSWNPNPEHSIVAVSALHQKDINSVSFHCSYPLFATCSDDCTAYVFHGMVYSDLNQNPLIVPLEILRGHTSSNGRGVLDKFHPRQPWLFTGGADSVIILYCN